MAKIEENQDSKVIWTNPDIKSETRKPESFRLPPSTMETLKRITQQKGLSQADVIIRAIHAYSITALLIPEMSKEVQELIDGQVNALDYEFGSGEWPEQHFQYRQMLFKWSEDLEKFCDDAALS